MAEPTRERILSAAQRLFAEQGFGNVSMPVIAKASGITAGAIYKHFDSKAALFFEVVRRAVQATPPAPQAGGGLPDIIASYTSRRLKPVRQLAIEVHYAAAKDPAVKKLLRRALDQQIGDIRDALAATGDPEAELAAVAAMTFIMGLMHLETLAPQLVGRPDWQAFIRARAAALLEPASPG